MKRLAALLLCAAGAAGAQEPRTFEAPIVGLKGETIGTLRLRGGDNAVVGRIEIRPGGLTPGWRGLRFHRVGDCSDHGAFQRAGAPLNPDEGVKHGYLHPEGPAAGDLPNLFVAADGSANAEFASITVVLTGDEPDSLRDKDGSALVIHAEPDDHVTQPQAGGAGRVACAAIK